MHDKGKIPFKSSLGSLGFQCVVLNKNRNAFLIGERAHTSDYKPGWLTLPGGIFELDDTKKAVQKACLRELTEEVTINVKIKSLRLRAILREQNNLGTILLIEAETDSNVPRERIKRTKVGGNEEWENNELEWIDIADLNTLSKPLMEGITFLKLNPIYK